MNVTRKISKLLLVLGVAIFAFVAISQVTMKSANESKIILSSNNFVLMDEQFSEHSVSKVMVEVLQKNEVLAPGKPLYLVINSPGGDVVAGMRMITFLNSLNRKIHTLTIFGASMGFITVQLIKGDRLLLADSTLMSHRAKGGVQGEIPGSLSTRYLQILKFLTEINERVVSRTNGKWTLDTYNELIRDEYWCNTKDCISNGFADREVEAMCDSSLSGTVEKEVSTMFGNRKVQFSKCPLIPGPIGVSGE